MFQYHLNISIISTEKEQTLKYKKSFRLSLSNMTRLSMKFQYNTET